MIGDDSKIGVLMASRLEGGSYATFFKFESNFSLGFRARDLVKA